jgi:hypothetical protein
MPVPAQANGHKQSQEPMFVTKTRLLASSRFLPGNLNCKPDGTAVHTSDRLPDRAKIAVACAGLDVAESSI